MELVLERRALSSLPAIFLLSFLSATIMSVGAAFGQTSAADTSSHATSSSSGIAVTIIGDSTGTTPDSLATTVDTTKTADSLAALQDTTGGKKDTLATKKDTLQILTSSASYNTVPGFRIQILTTQSLSQAIGVKAEADSLLPNYNVYIVYDSPYYKVRVGNFRARYEAVQAIPYITSHGFPNAWSVPDNVFRNPVRRSN